MKRAPVLVVLVVILAGCGDEPVARAPTAPSPLARTEPPNTNVALSEKEAFVIGAAVTAARSTCRDGVVALSPGELRARVNDLIRLARRKPDDIGTAFGEPKNTPRNGLRQVVEALAEDDCAPAVEQTARDALATL